MFYNSKVFGQLLSRLRVQKGLTQEVFSALAGISRSHLAELESGKKIVKLSTFFQLAQALGLSPTCLLNLLEQEMKEKGEG